MTLFRWGVFSIALAAAVPAADAAEKDQVAVGSAIVRTTICADKYPNLAADLQAALRTYEARASSRISALARGVYIMQARGRLGDDIDGLLRVRPGIQDPRVLCENLSGELRGGNPAEDTKALEAWAPVKAAEDRKTLIVKLRASSPQQLAVLNRMAAEGIEIHYPSPLTVTDVKPGSRAEKAGIRKGDLIATLNGRPVKNYADLAEALADAPRTHPLDLTVQRVNPSR